ncbi:MAG: ATP-binding protein [candidate division WOR-3 bacterium]|nr:ATP-binding protein [candidate division WOR-3 bacterium]
MKGRIIKVTLISALVLLVVNTVFLIYTFHAFAGLSQSVKLNYRDVGKNLAKTIETAIDKNLEITSMIQDHVYREMLSSVKQSGSTVPLGVNAVSVYDTLTEGFYFSDIQDTDSFRIMLYQGKDIFIISKPKAWYRSIETKAGAGKYIQTMGNMPNIEYIVIQDKIGIVSATQSIDSISSILTDSLLRYSFVENRDVFRAYRFKGQDVYEFISPAENIDGILRIGFTSENIQTTEGKARIIFISIIIMILLSVFLITAVIYFYWRSMRYASRILEREREKSGYFDIINDSIIVASEETGVIECNRKAEIMMESAGRDIEDITDILKENSIDTGEDFDDKEVHIDDRIFIASGRVIPEASKTIITLHDITAMEKLKKTNRIMEKQAAMGEMSALIAHELKNPLNGISILIQRIIKKGGSDSMIMQINDEVERINERIMKYMEFSKTNEYHFTICSIDDVIAHTLSSLSVRLEEKGIDVSVNSEGGMISADSQYLATGLKNIMENALEAVGENGRIEVKVLNKGNKVSIIIEDNGPGIPQSDREKIFRLYYSTKEKGSGIGLSTAYRIIKDHQGSIDVESSELGGVLFRINLPAEDA